jgi:uncharacterized membrane protein SpoIIM required for sporulation
MTVPDNEVLDQLAGLTGLGWTGAILGYLGTVFGYGTSLVSRLAVEPHSLLYLGCALFAATLGLDRLQAVRSDRTEEPDAETGESTAD